VVAGATSAASPSAALSLTTDTHPLQRLVASRLGDGLTRPFRDTIPRTPAPHFPRTPAPHYSRLLSVVFPPGYWGGTYTASNGENVTVAVSDYYLQDPAGPQSYAEFFATALIHGPELAQLAVVVVEPLSAVQQDCGGNALACYYPSDQLMLVPGEDPQAGVPLESIVAHEYGHHVANHNVNTPWAAIDWGTKRWASYENICTRTLQHTAYPGDEAENYTLNPGEAFADTYRKVRHEVAETEGCRSVRLTRGVESPSRFVLLVDWDSVEAHEGNFRASDRFARWRAAIGPHFARPPQVEHYVDIDG